MQKKVKKGSEDGPPSNMHVYRECRTKAQLVQKITEKNKTKTQQTKSQHRCTGITLQSQNTHSLSNDKLIISIYRP